MRVATGFGGPFGAEALEGGLGRVVDEAHALGDGAVPGLVGDEPMHLLRDPAVGRVALGPERSSRTCMADLALRWR